MTYVKKTWVHKEIIKGADLNHMEDGIATLDEQVTELSDKTYKTNDATATTIADGNFIPFFDGTNKKKISFTNIKGKFGTAAFKDVPTSGNASTSQVVMGSDTRLTDSRPASDVPSWAKASTKPTYTASEVNAYTKTEVDNLFAQHETNISWKEAVDTFADLATTYPNPQEGWTVNVKDTDYTYSYNGTEWVAISANAIPNATTSVNGLMTTTQVTKLNGIATGAEVNQNAFSNVRVGSTIVAADAKTDTLELVGSNVTLTPDATNDKVTIGITKANVTDALGYTPPTANTTYSAGTGISLSGTTINHSNSITAGTASGDASKTLDFGGTFTIPSITYDAQGHITSKGTTTMTLPSNPNTDTHYTTHLYAGSGTAANAATTNGNTKITVTDNSTVRNSVTIKGTGTTTVVSDANGVITINSADSKSGTVTKVSTGAGLTGGDITATGTIKAKLSSETKSTLTAAAKGSTADREYAVGLDASGNLSVNIPWSNTTYSVVSTSKNGLAPKVTNTSGYLKGDGTWDVPTGTTYSNMSQSEANTGTATTGRTMTAAVLRNTALPTTNSTSTFSTLADFWTAAEALMGKSQMCMMRCKISTDLGFGTGWMRVFVSEQNKSGNGSNGLSGSIIKDSGTSFTYYKVTGGITDKSDLAVTRVQIDNSDTHYTTHLYAGSGTAANKATTNGNTKITVVDNSTVRDSLTIKGTGATTVVSDANGVITINSTDNNTRDFKKGKTVSGATADVLYFIYS